MFFKRVFDFVASLIALILVSPVFVIVMPILKFTGEGWIFFVQQRVGRGDSRFGLLKFATMLRDSPKSGTVTARHDPRILPVGRFLRKTKINELPQILNVVKGDMAIVGPRPLTDEGFQYYSEDIKAVIRQIAIEIDGVRQTPRKDGLADAPDPAQPDDGASLPRVLDALLPVGTFDHTQRR